MRTFIETASRRALPISVAGAVILALASFGGGAVRNRGGILEYLHLNFVAFGHGRNVSLALFWVGMFLLVFGWLAAGRAWTVPTLDDRQTIPATLDQLYRWLWATVAPLLLAGPLASRDVYSYLMQGAMVRDGFDPYEEGAAVNPGPFLLEVSHDWRNTTTPYGPMHLWIGKIVTTICGDSVALGIILFKALSLAGFVAIAWSIPRIARHLGGNPALALWLGVANPVMLLHLIGGMHNESVMVGLVCLGLLAALRGRFLASIALIGVGVACKVTAFFALPFVLWLMIHAARERWGNTLRTNAAAFVAGGLIILAELGAVLAAVTYGSGTSWGWLSEITGNSKVINPLAGPTLVADIVTPLLQVFSPETTYNGVLAVCRSVAMVLMLLLLVVVWWAARGGIVQAIMGTAAAYQVAFVFNSVTLPWYYASVICLLGVALPPRWLLKLATAGSVVVGLSFSGDGNHQLYNWWWIVATVSLGWAAAEWLYGHLPQSTPPGLRKKLAAMAAVSAH